MLLQRRASRERLQLVWLSVHSGEHCNSIIQRRIFFFPAGQAHKTVLTAAVVFLESSTQVAERCTGLNGWKIVLRPIYYNYNKEPHTNSGFRWPVQGSFVRFGTVSGPAAILKPAALRDHVMEFRVYDSGCFLIHFLTFLSLGWVKV